MAGLQAVIGESIQQVVLPGHCVDTYYAGVSNVEKQCFPSKVQNKFYVNLNSTSSGSSSVVLFNPNQGVTDIALELTLPDLSGVSGLAINKGWGYRAIKQLSWRFASAAQYFVGGSQHYISVLESCEDAVKRQTLVELGGQTLLTPADFADPTKRKAYVYIKIPSNTPNSHKQLPYPSDLTTQPLQLTIDLEDWSKLFVAGSAIPSGLQAFTSARVNFRQVELNNANDLLAHRENMSEKMYIYPLDRFEQREIQIPLSGSGAQQSVQLTGFRSGEITHIALWAVDNGDLANGNWFNYQVLSDVVLTVNGDIRYDTRDQSSVFWDTVSRETPPTWQNTVITAGAPNTAAPSTGYFLVIPMGQERSTLGNEFELCHGYNVMNSVLNLQVSLPANANGYTLYAAYWYNSSLAFTNGQVDYIF